jgi:hypothetical protein
MTNTGQPYQQQSGGGGAAAAASGGCSNRGNASSAAAASVYSAKVLAFQQGSNRQAPPASMGISSGSSQSSRPPSADDSADSFFHFDSISSHQPYQHPHHLSFPPSGPLHPSELQLAGKQYCQPPKNPPYFDPILPDCLFLFFFYLLFRRVIRP